MRDPRLIEIDFLMAVDAARGMHLRSPLSESDSGVRMPGQNEPNRFGLDAFRFRDMVIDLILRDFLISDSRYQRRDRSTSEHEFMWMRRQLTSDVVEGHVVMVHISHAGRVHVWNQRDALLRDPDLEPFGLRSRAAWDRELFVRLRFANEESPLSVIFLDLDNFGAVNKTLGATVGDAVLRVVFGLIKNIVGTRGAAYRYGGEEVGVLLPGVSQADSAKLAEDLRSTIERETHSQVPQLTGPQTASIGVMAFSASAENDAIVAKVDSLMRAAKKAGKNCVQLAG